MGSALGSFGWKISKIPCFTVNMPHTDTRLKSGCLSCLGILSSPDSSYLPLFLDILKPKRPTKRGYRHLNIYIYVYIYTCCKVKNWSNFCPLKKTGPIFCFGGFLFLKISFSLQNEEDFWKQKTSKNNKNTNFNFRSLLLFLFLLLFVLGGWNPYFIVFSAINAKLKETQKRHYLWTHLC